MERVEAAGMRSEGSGANGSIDAQSVASSFEHLVDGAQGVIAKRIDLALLEGQELLSSSIQRAAFAFAGTVFGVTAWLAGAGALALLAVPEADPVLRLAVFAFLNGGAAVGLVVLSMRRRRPLTAEPVPAEEKDRS